MEYTGWGVEVGGSRPTPRQGAPPEPSFLLLLLLLLFYRVSLLLLSESPGGRLSLLSVCVLLAGWFIDGPSWLQLGCDLGRQATLQWVEAASRLSHRGCPPPPLNCQ